MPPRRQVVTSHTPRQQNVKTVYEFVIRDVCKRMKRRYKKEGVDEGVLKELETLWRTLLEDQDVFVEAGGRQQQQQQESGQGEGSQTGADDNQSSQAESNAESLQEDLLQDIGRHIGRTKSTPAAPAIDFSALPSFDELGNLASMLGRGGVGSPITRGGNMTSGSSGGGSSSGSGGGTASSGPFGTGSSGSGSGGGGSGGMGDLSSILGLSPFPQMSSPRTPHSAFHSEPQTPLTQLLSSFQPSPSFGRPQPRLDVRSSLATQESPNLQMQLGTGYTDPSIVPLSSVGSGINSNAGNSGRSAAAYSSSDGSGDANGDTDDQGPSKRRRIGHEESEDIPQVDGHDDDGDDDDDDGSLDDDDDDELLELEDESEDEEEKRLEGTKNIILALNDRVRRNKDRRRVKYKYGVMHLNGKDYVFHEASGDFHFRPV